MLYDPYKVKRGDVVYFYIISSINPQIYVPIRGRVESIIPKKSGLRFLISPLVFYSSGTYLKRFFMRSLLKHGPSESYSQLSFPDWVTTKESLEEFYKTQSNEEFYLMVPDYHCTDSFSRFKEIFNALIFYQISRTLADLKYLTGQPFYGGNFKFVSNMEFEKRLKDMIKDKAIDVNVDEFIENLDYNWINE